MVMAIGRSSRRLEESKYHSYLQEGGSKELQAHHSHLSPWEGDGENLPGKHFQTHEGQEGDQE